MRSIHLVSDVSATEQVYSSYQCLVPNSRLLRIVARYELDLLLIVLYFFFIFFLFQRCIPYNSQQIYRNEKVRKKNNYFLSRKSWKKSFVYSLFLICFKRHSRKSWSLKFRLKSFGAIYRQCRHKPFCRTRLFYLIYVFNLQKIAHNLQFFWKNRLS